MKDYKVPSVEEALQSLTNIPAQQLLLEELERQGMKVQTIEPVEIDRDPIYWGSVKGYKITLEDGRVFVPRLFNEYNNEGSQFMVYRYAEKLNDDTYEFLNLED